MYKIFFVFLITGILLFPGCAGKKNNTMSGKNDSTAGNFAAKKSLDFNEFYFVGKLGENSSVYKFISKSRQTGIQGKNFSKFWSKHNEKVIKLSYSPDKKSLFFSNSRGFW